MVFTSETFGCYIPLNQDERIDQDFAGFSNTGEMRQLFHLVLGYSFNKSRNMEHEELTAKIIGAAMLVHNHLGNGLQEVIYQRALHFELRNRGLSCEREKSMPIYFQGRVIGERRVDFFVEEKVMVEIKAVSDLNHAHLAQAKNYCQIYKITCGLLINFGAKSLQWKRLFNTSRKAARIDHSTQSDKKD